MKENDFVVAILNNPSFSVGDLQNVLGMDLENTQFLSKDEYLKSPFIVLNEAFKDINGNFSEDKFNKFYDDVSLAFNQFVQEDYIDNFDYSVWDTERPVDADIKDIGFNISQVRNPDKIDFGVSAVNEYSNPEFSKRELALNNKIYDPETDTWSDKTLNEMSLFDNVRDYFTSLFDEPLVYALYDEDTIETDPWTGEEVKHYKGEWKTDEWGNYYTEKLGGRSLTDRQVVSAFDYLTSEDSEINKYDFFDSDDLEKSIGGSIMKNVAAIIPLFTPVAPYYTGLLIAREMIKTLPMAYGMVTGLLGSNDNDSKLANTLRAYGEKFTTSTSDYAQLNTFSFENFANLASEVANQWSLQRLIALSFAKLTGGLDKVVEANKSAVAQYMKSADLAIKEANKGKVGFDKVFQAIGANNVDDIQKLISTNKWVNTPFGKAAIAKYVPAAEKIMLNRVRQGQDLSLAYMALVSNTDVYDTVKRKGGTGLEAAWITLGSTLGMFGVDKYLHLGEAFFSSDEARQAIRKAASQAADDITPSLLGTSRKDLLYGGLNIGQRAVKYFDDIRKDFVNHSLGRNLRGFAGKAFGEGLEEVSEELMADISKQIGEIAGQFGYASQEDYGAWEKAFDRYAMNFLGGAMGGGIFYGVDVYLNRGKNAKDFNNDMIYLIRNGKKNEIISEIGKLRDNGELGSMKLSMNKNDEGAFLTSKDKNDTQGQYVYEQLIKRIDELDSILNEYGLNLSDDELFNKMVLGEMRADRLRAFLSDDNGDIKKKSYITRYYEDVQKLANDITLLTDRLADLERQYKDSEKSSNQEYQAKKKQIQDSIDELNKKKEYLFKEGSLNYVEKLLFALDGNLFGQFFNLSRQMLSFDIFGKSYKTLSESEKEYVDKTFDEQSKQLKLGLDLAFKLYKKVGKEINPKILDFDEWKQTFTEEELQEIEKLSTLSDFEPLTIDYRLENENDDEYEHRNKKYDNESDQTFVTRITERAKKIQDIENKKKAELALENILKLSKMHTDRSTLRAKHAMIGAASKVIYDALLLLHIGNIFIATPDTNVDPTSFNNLIQLVRNLLGSAFSDYNEDELRTNLINIIAKAIRDNDQQVKDLAVSSEIFDDFLGDTLPSYFRMLSNLSEDEKDKLGIDRNYKWEEDIITVGDLKTLIIALSRWTYDSNQDKNSDYNSLGNVYSDVEEGIKLDNISERINYLTDAPHTTLSSNADWDTVQARIVGTDEKGNNITLLLYITQGELNNASINQKPVFMSEKKVLDVADRMAENFIDYGDFHSHLAEVYNVNESNTAIEENNLKDLGDITEDGKTYRSLEYLNNKYKYYKDGDTVTILDEEGNTVNDDVKNSIERLIELQYNDDWSRKTLNTVSATVKYDGETYTYKLEGDTIHIYNLNGTDVGAGSPGLLYVFKNAVARQKEGFLKTDLLYSPITRITNFFNEIKNDKLLNAARNIENQISSASLISPILSVMLKSIRGKSINLELILANIYDRFSHSTNPMDFQLTPEELNTLDELEQDINMAVAFIRAASSEASFNNPIQHNKALNQFVEKHKDTFKNYEELPEIDADKAQYIIHDAYTYLREILTWKQRHLQNTALKRIALTKTDKVLVQAPLELIKVNETAFKIGETDLLEGVHELLNTHTNTPYKNLTLIEEAIRHNFRKSGKKISEVLEAFKNKIFDTNAVSSLKKATINEKTSYKDLTAYDKFLYIVSVLAGDNLRLYQQIKDTNDKNANVAPLAIQEYAAKIANAMNTSPAIINEALDWFTEETDSLLTVLPNTVIIEGGAGAGKTSVVAGLNIPQNAKIWVSGPTLFLINGLKTHFTSASEYQILQLLEMAIGKENATKFHDDATNVKNDSKFFSITTGIGGFKSIQLKDNLKLNKLKDSEKPDYIIIDEASYLNTAEAKLISEWAKLNNIKVYMIADSLLNGKIDSSKGTGLSFYINNIGRESVLAWRTPTLSISLRDNNLQLSQNQRMFTTLLVNSDRDSTNEQEILGREWFINGRLKQQLRLAYYQQGNQFFGSKIISSLTPDITKYISSDSKIAYIGNKTDEDYNTLMKLLSNVSLSAYTKDEVQGQEFDFVFIGNGQIEFRENQTQNFASKASLTYSDIRNAYTLTTRARNGAFIIDHENKLSPYIDNIESKTTSITSIKDDIDYFKGTRTGIIDDILNIINDYRKKNPDAGTGTAVTGTGTAVTGTGTAVTGTGTAVTGTGTGDIVVTDTGIDYGNLDKDADKFLDKKPEDEGDNKLNKKEKDDETDIRVLYDTTDGRGYCNVTLSGITIDLSKTDSNGNIIWENSENTSWDLGIFLKQGSLVTDGEEKNKLVRKLLYLKSVILYGHTDDNSWNNLSSDITDLVEKDALKNLEWYITVEEINDKNVLVGSSLENSLRGIPESEDANATRYVVTIAAKFKNKNGNDCYVTMAGLANPFVWEKNQNDIKLRIEERIKNLEDDKDDDHTEKIKRLKDYNHKLSNKILEYKEDVLKIIKDYKNDPDKKKIRFLIDAPEMIGFTSLVNELSLRLENIYADDYSGKKSKTRWEVVLQYAVMTEPMILLHPENVGLSLNLRGKSVIFVSNDLTLQPDLLLDLYLLQKNDPKNHKPVVRMIVLSSAGVSFNSLYALNWGQFYGRILNADTATYSELWALKTPFSPEAMGIRIYMAAWNFRADMLVFKDAYDKFKKENNFTDKLIEDICKQDTELYKNVKKYWESQDGNKGKKFHELEYRQTVNQLEKDANNTIDLTNLDNIRKIWNFNDNLGKQKTRFRLGYEQTYGVQLRAITHYTTLSGYKKSEDNRNPIGIYITPTMMFTYSNMVNSIFTEFLDKLVTVNIDSKKRIKLNKRKSGGKTAWYLGWKNQKMVNAVVTDENGSKIATLENLQLPSIITMKFLEIGRYLRIMADKPDAKSYKIELKTVEKEGEKEEDLKAVEITPANIMNAMRVNVEGDNGTTITTPVLSNTNQTGFGIVKTNLNGQSGNIDLRATVFFNLLFHGFVVFPDGMYNDFVKMQNQGDQNATDAEFKYGFFADPVLEKHASKGLSDEGETAVIAVNRTNSKALLVTNTISTPGYLQFSLVPKLDNGDTGQGEGELGKGTQGGTTNTNDEIFELINNALTDYGISYTPRMKNATIELFIAKINKKANSKVKLFFNNSSTNISDLLNLVHKVSYNSGQVLIDKVITDNIDNNLAEIKYDLNTKDTLLLIVYKDNSSKETSNIDKVYKITYNNNTRSVIVKQQQLENSDDNSNNYTVNSLFEALRDKVIEVKKPGVTFNTEMDLGEEINFILYLIKNKLPSSNNQTLQNDEVIEIISQILMDDDIDLEVKDKIKDISVNSCQI